MADNNEIKAFVKKVIEMRQIQKEFFRTRSYAAMQTSKQLERDVDDLAKKLLAKIDGEEEASQPDLFSGVR